ncbi:MAG TPA: nucleotidyltransferase domain-containing protein [Solirubrobacteraceae bacterium]|jgi:predicted nucleotidyltransferase|nr:nucleotidyltransferase domain-containing protein [Solirubrobacteraceae bacterium]
MSMRTLADATLTDGQRSVVERLGPRLREGLNAESVWLYGSRARAEPPSLDSDVDLLVIAPGGRWENLLRADELLYDVAAEQGVDPTPFSIQVWDRQWLERRREIHSFFIQEVDRDKIVVGGAL